MKTSHYPHRSRSPGRSLERHKQSPKKSHGEGRPRGNFQQSVDKYLTLARDAAAAGDPVSAENFYQYADHYYRLVCESRPAHVAPPSVPSDVVEEGTPAERPPLERIEV